MPQAKAKAVIKVNVKAKALAKPQAKNAKGQRTPKAKAKAKMPGIGLWNKRKLCMSRQFYLRLAAFGRTSLQKNLRQWTGIFGTEKFSLLNVMLFFLRLQTKLPDSGAMLRRRRGP